MKIFVYGDVTCRGQVDMKRSTIDSDEILKYIEVKETGDEDALDDYFELMELAVFKATSKDMAKRRVELDRINLISMFSWEKDPRAIYEKLIKGKSISLMGEEDLYGFGLTKEAAMVAYAKAQAEVDGEMDDEEDW